MLSRIFFLLTNNIVVNNILIRLGLDHFFTSKFGMYRRIKIDDTLSPSEMAGFSSKPEVMEALHVLHANLHETVKNNVKKGGTILDIGCGPGTYLKDFENDYNLTGIDIHLQMINKAREYVKTARLIHNDFLQNDFTEKFNFIYSISLLEFIPPGQLRRFFRKIYNLLEDDGVLFIHYPHALKFKDTLYPDLYYIEYPPRRVESATKNIFKILSHHHAFDERQVDLYDKKPYSPNARTLKNGYILIAQKKVVPNV